MIKNVFFVFCSLLIISFAQAQGKKIQPVIFDTDMGPDYDDVGAITLLHSFADDGEINILATIASTKYEGVAAVLNVLNTYFKKPSIPIGVPKGFAITQKDWQHWTDTLIAKYPHAIKNNADVPDAIALYRKILAQQTDSSVTIITVGFLTNISNLLQSSPDQYSSLTGQQLINKKVKQLVCMAGKFPQGFEFNIKEDAKASRYVYKHWEKAVLFTGFEIGVKIKVGLPLISNSAIQNSPVKDVFRISIPLAKEDSAGRMSWDETAVLIAVKGYSPYYTIKSGTIKINDDGSDTWMPGPGNQYYIVEDKPVSEVQSLINTLIMHQPITRVQ